MQWSSRIHVMVTSPEVWKRFGDLDVEDYWLITEEDNIFDQDKTSFIIDGDWSCSTEKLLDFVYCIAERLEKDGIVIADGENLSADTNTFYAYFLGDRVKWGEFYWEYDEDEGEEDGDELPFVKGKMWEMHSCANIEDFGEWISYGHYFSLSKTEISMLKKFGIEPVNTLDGVEYKTFLHNDR